VVNDTERQAASPEQADEKQETSREKTGVHDEAENVARSLGSLQFTVGYDVDKSTLSVSVICAKNLPVKNATIGSSDPYVKLQLLPDKRQKVLSAFYTRTFLLS